MKINDEQYFTAGEFAAIVGVNKQTILYYDKIGLLPPAYKDDKNRRFYQVQHQEIFYLIEILQEMEMTLKEIKTFLAARTPEGYVKKLQEQHSAIQEKIERMQHAKSFIADQIRVEKNKHKVAPAGIEYVANQTFTLICTEEMKEFSSVEKSKKLARLMGQLQVKGANIGQAIGAILLREQIIEHNYTNPSYYCVFDHPLLPQGEQLHRRTITGDFLVAYHQGKIEQLGDTYEKVLRYIKDQKLVLGYYAIEKSIYGFVHEQDSTRHVTAVYVQLEGEHV